MFLNSHVFPQRGHTAEEPGSLFRGHEVLSLQFTHVYPFACRGRLRNVRTDFCTIVFYSVPVTWQQIVKGLLQVAVVVVVFVACDCWTPTYFNLCNETLASDSRKPHDIILCESEHEWIRSNASTSLKNSTSVSDCATNVPESRLINLRLCRFHTTWIVGIPPCWLVRCNR